MTDREKIVLIKRLALNLNPIDFTDEKTGLGAGHALCVAIDCILDIESEKEGE